LRFMIGCSRNRCSQFQHAGNQLTSSDMQSP